MYNIKLIIYFLYSMTINSFIDYKLDDLISLINYYQLNVPLIYFKSRNKLIEELINYYNLFNQTNKEI